jgi:undecaprenyl diphosphate synthase
MPNHISFIMDGNNRWSKLNSFSHYESYKRGANILISLANYIFENYKTNFISAFALSNNNLNRSTKFINTLKNVLLVFSKDTLNKDYNFNISFIGDLNLFNKETKKLLNEIETKNINKKKKLIIFLNYSGRKDIESSYNDNIKKKNYLGSLSTFNIPDPDMLIRTGGYQRVSDFMLYQIAFTELFFSKKLWPDLSKRDINNFINKYKSIKRKFGT